jgi:predicted metal-dependent hydrolase
MAEAPLLLALVHTPALRDALAHNAAGFDVRWSFEESEGGKAGEKGPWQIGGIAALHPVLIVIELDRPCDWLPQVRSDSATRRIPIIAIAASAAAEERAAAAQTNVILAPDDFVKALPDVLAENANIFGAAAALNAQCREAPSPLVLKGLREFNAHDFYECHETLETAWRKETGPVRELYRAILQIGIAYYQIERGNYWGAYKMFLRTLQWFEPLPDRCQGIDVARLRADADAARAHLESLGPDRIAEFDRALIKPVVYEEHEEGAPA